MDKDILLFRITELCQEKGIKPTTAFIKSGVGKNFKTNLNYANPSKKNLLLLSNYFDVSIKYLTGETDIRTPPETHIEEKAKEPTNPLSGLEFALYGELQSLTEDQQLDILEYIRFRKQQWEKRNKKGEE